MSEVTVMYQNSLPVISVRLPSRREHCQFTLKPLTDSVGVFLQQLQAEDRGIDRVAIYSTGTTTHASTHTLYQYTVDSGLRLRHPQQVLITEVSYAFKKCSISSQAPFSPGTPS